MFCNNCGAKNNEGSRFCSGCGSSLFQVHEKKNKSSNFAIFLIKLTLKVILLPLTIPLGFLKFGFGIKTLKCPRCEGKKFNKVKPGQTESMISGLALLALGPFGLIAKRPTTLIVCRQCHFSWESR